MYIQVKLEDGIMRMIERITNGRLCTNKERRRHRPSKAITKTSNKIFKSPFGLLLWLCKSITNVNYGNKRSGIGWWKWELHTRVTNEQLIWRIERKEKANKWRNHMMRHQPLPSQWYMQLQLVSYEIKKCPIVMNHKLAVFFCITLCSEWSSCKGPPCCRSEVPLCSYWDLWCWSEGIRSRCGF